MQTSSKYFFAVILQFTVMYCAGQMKPQLRFFHIGIDQGLSNNTVNCLLQDRTGFLWVGTENGLNRYDGYQFVLVGGGNDSNTIASQQISSLAEDVDGNIWIGTRTGGLHRYDPKKGNILHFVNTERSKILSDNFIRKLCYTDNGMLWLGTPGGVTRFDTKTYRTKIFRHIKADKQSLGHDDVRAFCKRKNANELWIGTYGAVLCHLNLATEKFKSYPYAGWQGYHPDSLNTASISALFEDDENRLFMGGYGGDDLEYLNISTGKFVHIDIKRIFFSTTNEFVMDSEKRLWMGGWEGLGLLDSNLNLCGKFVSDEKDKFSLTERHITCMIKDRNGVIWMGTRGGGLNYFYPFSEKFMVFPHNDKDPYSMSTNFINSIFKDKAGRLWIGTRYGLDSGRLETGRFKIFRQSASAPDVDATVNRFLKRDTAGDKLFESLDGRTRYLVNSVNGSVTMPKSEKKNPFPYNNQFITVCIVDQRGNLWFGDFGSGLYRIDLATKDFTFFAHYPRYGKAQLSYGGVTDILEDSKGYLWLGTERGLDMFDPVTQLFTNHKMDIYDSVFFTNSQSINYIERVKEDAYGNIWVGTRKAGVQMLDVRRKTFTSYNLTGDSAATLGRITTLLIAGNGLVYAGTESQGMLVINPQNKRVSVINLSNGLPDNDIAGILEDNKSFLWISTYHGLCKFDPLSSKVIRIFTKNDGLPSDEFYQGACYKDSEGRMYFGNAGGLVSFLPGELDEQSIDPPLVLTDLQLFNHSLSPGDRTGILAESITSTKEIVLNYDQNIITLGFASLGFVNSTNIEYIYRLVNFNDEWFTTKPGEHSVTYTSLQPGSYVFEVRSRNRNTGHEGKVKSLSIEVVPPFWKTWWFRLLAALALAAIVYSYFNWRLKTAIKKTKEKTETERKISALSLAALRSQMNPHFIFNSLNSIQHYIHSNQREQAENFLSTFASLIRQILDNSAHAVIPLSDEIHTIQLYLILEKVRFGERLQYKIEIDEGIDPEDILVPSMLIQPYIENAIIHGITPKEEGGSVWVDIKQAPNFIICRVTDDGVGTEKALEIKGSSHRRSHGMNVTKARLEILNKQLNAPVDVKITNIYDNQNKASGTQVEIFIPLQERF